jgi:uncharacterized protein YutE (UPF0331/DUF86 family)
MVDKELVNRKLLMIQNDLNELIRFKDLSFDEISKNYDTHKIVERILELIINEAIDINQHIISESNLGKMPSDFKESFTFLSKISVYSEEFSQKIGKSVGLRNILVHQYRELDETIFYNSIILCIKEYQEYCNYILKYLEKV